MSFRLGGTDGVAIESAKWVSALRELGHDVQLVAGEGNVDLRLPGLAIGTTTPLSYNELARALDDADLVIVENLASLPLNLNARDVLYEVLHERRALFHHHDLPWQRDHLAHLEGPRDEPSWHHVTINELSQRQLAERGIRAVTIYNSFDCDPPRANRAATRAALGLKHERLVLMPTRVIERKNVGQALELAQSLDAVLWILGPVEDGYDATFAALLAASTALVRHGPVSGTTVHDAYAACDLVVMASTWEGFGNPVLESVTHRRALALHPYPVAQEIAAFGFSFFGVDEPTAIRDFWALDDHSLLDANLAIAREHFNVANLATRLNELLAQVGISSAH